MITPTNSLTALLERIEGELQTADGRTVRVCRDPSGKYWVVDGAERIVPLDVFAAYAGPIAQEYCAGVRAQQMRRRAARIGGALVRLARYVQRLGAQPAHV